MNSLFDLENEIWMDIPNYKGYQVSNLGRVRTYNKTTYTEKHKLRKWKNRILKQKKSTNKYGRSDYRVELWASGKHKTFLVSRLVAFTFYKKDINSKLTINHINGNSEDNRLENLEIVSLQDNIKHEFKNGLISSMKHTKVIDKITGNEIYFQSMANGSRSMKKNIGYISLMISKNKYENQRYKWEVI